MKCIVCNSPLETTKYKPRTYCSQNCADYMKFKNALEKSILKLNLDDDAKKLIRGDLFALRNLV